MQILQPSASLQIIPVSRDILVAAARLRAETNMKLPDAIHAATAQFTGCDQFLTNDARVPSIPGLAIRQLSELEP